MTKTTASDHLIKTFPLNKLGDNLSTTDNNNEVDGQIESINPIQKILHEDHAYGDNTQVELRKDLEKSFELFTNECQQYSDLTPEDPDIPRKSSCLKICSSNVIVQHNSSLAEALESDHEYRSTHQSYISNVNQIGNDRIEILTNNTEFDSISLQRLPIDPCEYEIDLGNGRITKSISNYQSDDKHQSRPAPIISANSIQPIAISKMSSTNTYYRSPIYSKQESLIDNGDESDILFNTHHYTPQRKAHFPFRLITVFSIGTPVIILMIVLIVFVF